MRRAIDWLAAPTPRIAIVLMCFAIGCTIAGTIYVGKREDARADRERAHERHARRKEDRRLHRLERANSQQIERLIRDLTPAQSRRLARRLIGGLTSRERAELGLPTPPGFTNPPRRAPRRQAPGSGSPGPAPGPTTPAPPPPSSPPPTPPRPPILPRPPLVPPLPLPPLPIDPDGDGPLPPIELPILRAAVLARTGLAPSDAAATLR